MSIISWTGHSICRTFVIRDNVTFPICDILWQNHICDICHMWYWLSMTFMCVTYLLSVSFLCVTFATYVLCICVNSHVWHLLCVISDIAIKNIADSNCPPIANDWQPAALGLSRAARREKWGLILLSTHFYSSTPIFKLLRAVNFKGHY